LIVPVPTTARRLQQRGYNQAELIAARLADVRHTPLYRALGRRNGGRSQTTLTSAERRENVRGAFTLARRAERRLRGAHVLLVDDVLTTGSTAGEAATTLAAGGATSVTLIAFARALPSSLKRAA
jgi:ComF family protein